jgi:hypothetical protein
MQVPWKCQRRIRLIQVIINLNVYYSLISISGGICGANHGDSVSSVSQV